MDETQTLIAEADSALSVFADLSVSTSLIMLVLLAVGLAWVVRGRRRLLARERARRAAGLGTPAQERLARLRRQAAQASARLGRARRTSAAAVAVVRRGAVRRVPELLDGVRRLPSGLGSAVPPARRGRLALAAGAALGLLAFIALGLAALAGRATGGLAAAGLLLALVSLAGLRVLTVRERTRRRVVHRVTRRAPRSAGAVAGVAPEVAAAPEAEPAVVADPARDRRILDTVLAFETDASERAAGTTVAAPEAPAAHAVPAEATPVPAAPSRLSGVVVPAVPRPTYLDAPEMERPAPAPLVAEPAPASRARLKDGVPARSGGDAVRPEAEREIAALDLDNVLARRRAS